MGAPGWMKPTAYNIPVTAPCQRTSWRCLREDGNKTAHGQTALR